jgi:hypothetical protein
MIPSAMPVRYYNYDFPKKPKYKVEKVKKKKVKNSTYKERNMKEGH